MVEVRRWKYDKISKYMFMFMFYLKIIITNYSMMLHYGYEDLKCGIHMVTHEDLTVGKEKNRVHLYKTLKYCNF